MIDIEKLAKEWAKMREENRVSYTRQYHSLVAFLQKEGKIIPGDEADFFDWFFNVKADGVKITVGNLRSLATIEPKHFKEFHEYKKRLFDGLSDTRPLSPFFHSSEKLDLALRAANETGLLNDDGVWVYLGQKTNAISAFWRAAVTAGLAKADAPIYKVSKAIKDHFSMDSLGINAIDKKREISDFGEEYKELYKALLAIMRA